MLQIIILELTDSNMRGRLFAAEQAILQLHGIVVKHAAPSFASQPSNHAFFGLYQSSSTIVQKLFKNLSSECT